MSDESITELLNEMELRLINESRPLVNYDELSRLVRELRQRIEQPSTLTVERSEQE